MRNASFAAGPPGAHPSTPEVFGSHFEKRFLTKPKTSMCSAAVVKLRKDQTGPAKLQ